MSDDPNDRDLTAGEYVLGVLESAEAQAVAERIERDQALAEAVDAWRVRLAPLALAVPAVPPPPNLWARITTSLGLPDVAAPVIAPAPTVVAMPPKPKRLTSRVGFWRFTTAASLAMAAGFAGFLWLGRPAAPDFAAALAPLNAPAPVFLARWEADGTLIVRPVGSVPVPPPGKDLELWLLPEGAKQPQSLGVLPRIGRQIVAPARTGSGGQLLVSLEPAGGSPTGQPTGPVLYGGAITRLE